ncbi:MAG: hypothetical protein LC808_28780 [Actinobacteria bacterium]|nr:hypothetical protein [Actinomycetota bacterium]
MLVADWELPDEYRPYALGWQSGVHFYRFNVDDSLTPVVADGTGRWLATDRRQIVDTT